MAFKEYEQQNAPVSEPSLPGGFPRLPDAMLKRFPEVAEYHEEAERFWRKVRSAVGNSNEEITRAASVTTADVLNIREEVDGNIATALLNLSTAIGLDGVTSSYILSLTAASNDNAASIITESSARANADLAISHTITALEASIMDVSAAVSIESGARADADGALAFTISTLSGTVGDVSASVVEEAELRIAADGEIHAKWGVSIDVNGNIVGRVQLDGTNASSDFLIAVDKLRVTNVTDTLTLLEIRSAGPSPAIVFGADVQSDDFSPGVSGWRIQRSGDVEFGSGVFRGTVSASNIITDSVLSNAANPGNTLPAACSAYFDVGAVGIDMVTDVPAHPAWNYFTDNALILQGWAVGTGFASNRFGKPGIKVILTMNGNCGVGGTAGVDYLIYGPAYRVRTGGGAWGAWTGHGHDNYSTVGGEGNIQYCAFFDLTLGATDEVQFGLRLAKTAALTGTLGAASISIVGFSI